MQDPTVLMVTVTLPNHSSSSHPSSHHRFSRCSDSSLRWPQTGMSWRLSATTMVTIKHHHCRTLNKVSVPGWESISIARQKYSGQFLLWSCRHSSPPTRNAWQWPGVGWGQLACDLLRSLSKASPVLEVTCPSTCVYIPFPGRTCIRHEGSQCCTGPGLSSKPCAGIEILQIDG